ncbi:MAG TPA: acyl carrier protein [Steroidobacteraceae bacterium]|nr:acyl carrier protein [Steroidobacteraceae bacterium]
MARELSRQALRGLLREIRPESDFEASRDFLSDGMLDSFDMVALVAALDEACGISIDGADILPEHFQNLEAIAGLLRRYGVRP